MIAAINKITDINKSQTCMSDIVKTFLHGMAKKCEPFLIKILYLWYVSKSLATTFE